jgi:hypothetical protein
MRDASITTRSDAGAACPQVGNLPVPVYGIGIDFRPADTCRDVGDDAGADAGRDAGNDAAAEAGEDAGPKPMPLPVPPYGVAIDRSAADE